ncbi:SMC-Scp complex subunit ScpB [Salinisphaera aquimarina]|uniref:SMC-Scp complex subunit ScpB n=1 Tax=Salinisphaera aquimarina TaxID=2094031 RepID=A0ABV7EW01_9GAMM
MSESSTNEQPAVAGPNNTDEAVVPEAVVHCIEALLMAADAPLSIDQLIRLLDTTHAVERADVRLALDALCARYAEAAVDVVEVAGGWRFQVGADYAGLVSRLWEERPPKLSRAMLETLALICYRQPIARSDIEAVRGVSVSSNIVKTLQEFDWIKVVGYREVPGRPALFGTTPKFLDDFGVKRLADLPSLPEIKDLDALEAAMARFQTGAADAADDQNSSDDVDAADPAQAAAPDERGAPPEDDAADEDSPDPERPLH